MGSKNLKAIAVQGSGRVQSAEPEQLRELAKCIRQYAGFEMLKIDTLNAPNIKRDACSGCTWRCMRQTYRTEDGTSGKYMCQAAWFYQARAYQYYGEANDVPFLATRLCDEYGLDTGVVENIIFWLSRCSKSGVLNDDNTGIPLSAMGSLEFMETLVRKIALKEGFGEILAQGPEKAAQMVGEGTPEFITDYTLKAGQNSYYDGRMFVTTGLLYAMEPRQPIQQLHEISGPMLRWVQWAGGMEGAKFSSTVLRAIAKRFWGGEIAADLSTYEGKALAAQKIQDRQYAKESLILCDFAWPVMYAEDTVDHVGDPTLESRLFSAVCGRQVDEQGLYDMGARIFNLQRAILVREGHHGRDHDRLPDRFYTIPLKEPYPHRSNPECLAPGKDGEIISRKGKVVEREKFEAMKTEYYQLRGWDPDTGLQKKEQLEDLGLADIAREMEERGLLSQT